MKGSRDRVGDDEGDALARYLESIRRYPLLSREAEHALAVRAHAGDEEARDALVCANLRFVIAVAKRYRHHGVPLADLVSEGNLGLLRAARRFDPARGIKFISYAVWWIRQAMLQTLAEQSRLARVPPGQVAMMQRIGRHANALAQELGREPTQHELAERVALTQDALDRRLALLRPALSIDDEMPEHGVPLAETLAAEDTSEPDAAVVDAALVDGVSQALGALSPRQARVLRLYFGLDGGEGMTLQEIGAHFGITRERVRQIKEQALRRLRQSSRARALGAWAPSVAAPTGRSES